MAITNVGDVQNFAYTGGMQSFTVPVSGVYKLEVYGAAGGARAANATNVSKGGYSVGYVLLNKGETIYVCCGQKGATEGTATTYNGGGKGCTYTFNLTDHFKPTMNGPSGGGATHIARQSGTLAQIGEANKSKILIVAGGGGGQGGYTNYIQGAVYANKNGGNGGGTSGGYGTRDGSNVLAGGTQSGGNAFGQGGSSSAYWGNWDSLNYGTGAGAGGGFYGGKASNIGNNEVQAQAGAGGGSGYIGGVPNFTYKGVAYNSSTTVGHASATGNGTAKITFVAKSTLPVTFNGTTLEKIIFNGVEVKSLAVNGVKLFMERMKRRMQAWNTSTSAGSPSSRPI